MKKSYESPVYKVKAVPLEKVQANSYNPNKVAPPEMKLLYLSIKEDGYTQPVVCYYIADKDVYEIVDGFHRYLIMKNYKDIYDRENGMLDNKAQPCEGLSRRGFNEQYRGRTLRAWEIRRMDFKTLGNERRRDFKVKANYGACGAF